MLSKKGIIISIIIGVSSLLIGSCYVKHTRVFDVEVCCFLSDSLINKSYQILELKKCDYGYTYTYSDKLSNVFTELVVNDTGFKYNNTDCKFLNTIQYMVGDEKYDVKAFMFDIARSIDEEFVLFFNSEYGLLLEYSNDWDIHKTYKMDSISQQLINKIKKRTESNLPKPTSINR